MSETQNTSRSLNPWVFHLQKLALELKCPLCLNLLDKPMLLPCNHIFCNFCVPNEFRNECPACQQHFTDEEIRHAAYMENIVTIYKSLDVTFNSTILPLLSTDSRSQTISSSPEHLRKKLGEASSMGKSKYADNLIFSNSSQHGVELKYPVPEEVDVNRSPEISPDSSPSSVDAKDAEDQKRDSGCRNGSTENHAVKRSGGDNIGTAAGGRDAKGTSHTREPKRQKKLCYRSSEPVLQGHVYSHRADSYPDQAAVSNYNEECNPREGSSDISSMAPYDASNVDGSICAFCHSSKIIEGTGEMLHYANGKEVTRDETAFSKAIPVHRKCIEWTPQVYFVGERIKNLESELARASKLKCSSCGLKGAGLGCFAKSCRRSYHVPCAVDIPDCKWDCDNFVMLCPTHNLIKFPSEQSSLKRRYTEEKCSMPTHTTSKPLDFWTTSPSESQEWFFCGSALSLEEKRLMVEFAKICGATVLKFWNPKVTHVIAATDANGACSRTLKVLMAILNGKWILTMDWVKACVEANCPVNEEPYEVKLDNHGCRDGPMTGRLKASSNAPELFDGLSFYFNGDFVPGYKSDLLNLVRAGGGTTVDSFDQIVSQQNPQALSTAFVVYNHDTSQGCATQDASSLVSKRLAEAEDVAKGIDAKVVPHTWILESIAACSVLPHPSF